VNAAILPSSQGDLPIRTFLLPCFQHFEWREEPGEGDFVLCEELTVLLSSIAIEHNIINDEVVAPDRPWKQSRTACHASFAASLAPS
jgi:hypothetical protein